VLRGLNPNAALTPMSLIYAWLEQIDSLFYMYEWELSFSTTMNTMMVNVEQKLRTVQLLLHNQSPAYDCSMY
jgi:hypothetical protein